MSMTKSMVFAGLILAGIGHLAIAAEKEKVKAPDVQIRSDPCIELVSIIFHLAGHPEYNRIFMKSYAKDIEEHFGKFRDHEAVVLARKLRQTRGVSYDAPMSLAVHLTDGVKLTGKVSLDPLPEKIDKRWTEGDVKKFLAAARKFAEESKFEEFYNGHEPLYAKMQAQLKTLLEKEAHLEWFSEFFGERPQTAFILVPSVTNGPNNYGSSCRTADGKEEIYCILGVWKLDSKKQPLFDGDVLSTITHEFCHSHTNPLVDRHEAELKAAGEKLFKHVGKTMERHAYGNWKTMMYESMVRACTIEYLMKYRGKMAAGLGAMEDRNRGFEWIGELSSLLEKKFEKNREKYPTLEAFMPEVVEFFNKYADDFDNKRGEVEKTQPKVVKMTPADGDEDVDPNLKEIRIEFDRPMKDKSWSVVGGGPAFPELLGKPAYNKERKILTIKVKLKPDHEYQFMLNSDRFHGFQSEDGVPLEPVDVKFKTKG